MRRRSSLTLASFSLAAGAVSGFSMEFAGRKLARRPQAEQQPLATKAGGDILREFTNEHDLSPLERIAMTCSGNLQTTVSAYHTKPVEVFVIKNEPLPTETDCDGRTPVAMWDRVVVMKTKGKVFCTASTIVRMYDEALAEVVGSHDVGIGQMLRLYQLPPTFALHDCGRLEDGALWRYYSMDCTDKIKFDIIEEFSKDCWDLQP
mmetsp:Transcript_17904/g.30898  ORF Transcript_17904/g.30898 Transcript_17904/m.30898 type:complete len:205 (+) Transcript_17904:150-764(+)